MTSIQLAVTHISGLKKGERENFTSLPITIGRAPGSKLRLAANDTRASARHAEISFDGNSLVLRDLESTNGTYINGQPVERVKLTNGDIVEFGIDGPKLCFEFLLKTEPPAPPVAASAPANAPPPLAVQPANAPAQNAPQFGISNQAGVNLAVAPPSLPEPTPGQPSMLMAIEEREFRFKNKFKFVLFAAAALLMLSAIILFIKQIIIWTVPAGLIGIFLLFMGWSCARINITANNQGIHYQGILRSTLIRWDDIIELRVFRSRTRLLTHLVYVVRSRNNSIVFAVEDYEDGLDLASLIARRARLSW